MVIQSHMAVFFIKYLRLLGFDAENDLFAENSWYFRNALVRANYTNIKEGIYETTEFLELFLRNLLLSEKNKLHNREMHVSGKFLLGHDDPINDLIKRKYQSFIGAATSFVWEHCSMKMCQRF